MNQVYKDKLMTLEDFKAVRDVDVASNSAQFTEIKAYLDAIDPLTSEVKAALLNCFDHVAWEGDSGHTCYDALYNVLYATDSRIAYEIASGTDMSNISIDTEQHAYKLTEDFTIIAKVSVDADISASMFLLDSQSTGSNAVGARMQCSLSNGNLTFRNAFNGGASGGATVGAYPASSEHDVIFILRNASKNITSKIYVDGTLDWQESKTITDRATTYPATYYIGKTHSNSVSPWVGKVGVFRIYNTALSDNEINAIISQ